MTIKHLIQKAEAGEFKRKGESIGDPPVIGMIAISHSLDNLFNINDVLIINMAMIQAAIGKLPFLHEDTIRLGSNRLLEAILEQN